MDTILNIKHTTRRPDQQGGVVPQPSSAFDPLRSLMNRETLLGQRKRDRTWRLVLAFVWMLLALADSSTMFFVHLSAMAAICAVLWQCHTYCFLKLLTALHRHRLVQLANPPPPGTTGSSTDASTPQNLSNTFDDEGGNTITTSEQLERFTAHFGLCLIFCLARLLVLPEAGNGGSISAGLVTIVVCISMLRTGWCTLNPDIRQALATKEAWLAIFAVAYWIAAMCLLASGHLPISPITQTLFSIGLLVLAIKRTSLKISFFPLVWFFATLVIVLVFCGFGVWLTLASTNPSWALVLNNTKVELLQRMGISNDFILNAREVCTHEDAALIPESQFPLIFKPNLCTTSNYGVKPIFNYSDAFKYISNAPMPGRKLHRGGCYTMAQRFVKSRKEFVIYYVRYPYFSKGFIKTIGVRAKARQVEKDQANTAHHSQGFFSDYFFTSIRPDLATPKLEKFVDDLSNSFPGGWHQGRIDVKVAQDEDLGNAEGLGILEINLNMIADIGEKVNHANLDDKSIRDVNTGIVGFLMPVRMVRTFGLMIYLGAVNLLMGSITPTMVVKGLPFLVGRAELCQKNYLEHLMGRE